MSRENSTNNQLVPYFGQNSDANSPLFPTGTTSSGTSNLQLVKVESYKVSTLKKYEDGTISLSDIDDDQIDSMILTEEESRLKKHIWDSLNKDWIRQQK